MAGKRGARHGAHFGNAAQIDSCSSATDAGFGCSSGSALRNALSLKKLYTRTAHLHYIVPYECMCPPIMWLRIMLLGICTMNLAWTYVVKVAVAQISKTRYQTFLAVALIRTTYPLSSSLGPGSCMEKLSTLASSGVSRMSQRDFWSSTRGGPPSQPVGRKCCKTTSEAIQ